MPIYVVVLESWLDDKGHYDYANMSAWRSKEAAETEAEILNETLIPDGSFDSYFVDEIGLF